MSARIETPLQREKRLRSEELDAEILRGMLSADREIQAREDRRNGIRRRLVDAAMIALLAALFTMLALWARPTP